MNLRYLVKVMVLGAVAFVSNSVQADYGEEAAHAYMDDVLAQLPKDNRYPFRVAGAIGSGTHTFNQLYQVGLAYQGQTIDEGKARQYVLSVAQSQQINDNELFKRFMAIGVQAIKDGAAGIEHPTYSTQALPMRGTKNVTCDITRIAPSKEPGGDGEGIPKETLKGAVSIKFTATGAVVMLPYDSNEHQGKPTPRTLILSDDGQMWYAEDDNQVLSRSNTGFNYVDGPGVHRSTFDLKNCK